MVRCSILLVVLVGGCTREPIPTNDAGSRPDVLDPFAPCTDPSRCCPSDELICHDGGEILICHCPWLWDCPSPDRCRQAVPTPPGEDTWSCYWTEFKYTCAREVPGGEPGVNPQGQGWSCAWEPATHRWTCAREPPNPSNKPEGAAAWRCVVEQELLVCTRGAPDPPHPEPMKWTCTSEASGQLACVRIDLGGGLPPTGDGWRCHRYLKSGISTWLCHGESGSPPGGNGWNCAALGKNQWRCVRAEDATDQPPGGGHWACAMGSALGGTRCVKLAAPGSPTPQPGDPCVAGEKRWCDVGGLWGQVACDPAKGTWKTSTLGGAQLIDCVELASGERPNTVCACYHPGFHATCCERPDCVLVAKGSQQCPPSDGALCSPCNPEQPACAQAGAVCVTSAKESFCGSPCSAALPCPSGYACKAVKVPAGTTSQCVPLDDSCYHD